MTDGEKRLMKEIAQMTDEGYHPSRLAREFVNTLGPDRAVNGLKNILNRIHLSKNPLSEIFNIGNNKPTKLLNFIHFIEKFTNKKIIKDFVKMQRGDVFDTHANIEDSIKKLNYVPSTSIESGLNKFVNWYLEYYNNFFLK